MSQSDPENEWSDLLKICPFRTCHSLKSLSENPPQHQMDERSSLRPLQIPEDQEKRPPLRMQQNPQNRNRMEKRPSLRPLQIPSFRGYRTTTRTRSTSVFGTRFEPVFGGNAPLSHRSANQDNNAPHQPIQGQYMCPTCHCYVIPKLPKLSVEDKAWCRKNGLCDRLPPNSETASPAFHADARCGWVGHRSSDTQWHGPQHSTKKKKEIRLAVFAVIHEGGLKTSGMLAWIDR